MHTQAIKTARPQAPAFVHEEIKIYKKLEQRLRAKGNATIAEADHLVERMKTLETRLDNPDRKGAGYYSPEGRKNVVAGRLRRSIAQNNGQIATLSTKLEALESKGWRVEEQRRLRRKIANLQYNINCRIDKLKEMGAELPNVEQVGPLKSADDFHNTRRRQMKVVKAHRPKTAA